MIEIVDTLRHSFDCVKDDETGHIHLVGPLPRELWISDEMLLAGDSEHMTVVDGSITFYLGPVTARYRMIGPLPHRFDVQRAILISQSGGTLVDVVG